MRGAYSIPAGTARINDSVVAASWLKSRPRLASAERPQPANREYPTQRFRITKLRTLGGGRGATLAAWGYFGGVGLLWRRGATCWRRGATCWRRGATCWRAILVLGLALLLTALGAALLVTGFAVLLLLPGTLAVVPPIITAIPPGGLRIRGCCDHHASACEKR